VSVWRPSPHCLYVVGDIEGRYPQLELLLARMLPLRRTGGASDTLVFLGDYLGAFPQGDKVVDRLMGVSAHPPARVVCLRGAQEETLLELLDEKSRTLYAEWLVKLGGSGIVKSYLTRKGLTTNPFEITIDRLSSLVPEEHVTFFRSLPYYWADGTYIFAHAGCDPTVPLDRQPASTFTSDGGLMDVALQGGTWPATVVVGHHGPRPPFMSRQLMMLDASGEDAVLVAELNSMEAFLSRPRTSRLLRVDLTESKWLK